MGWFFFDPPYVMLKDVRPGEPLYRMFLRLARPDITTEDVLVVLRGPECAEYTLPDCWQIERKMKVGSMELALIRKAYATPLPENQTDEDSGVESDEPQAGN